MTVIREKKCPRCGNVILDLGLTDDEGALCYTCYRKAAANKKEHQEA